MVRNPRSITAGNAANGQGGHPMHRLIARLGVAIVLVASVASPVTAASPHQLDPAQMIPPLNPDYAPWVCTETGDGSVCRGEFSDAWSAEDLGTEGLACDGQSIYTTGRHHSQFARWHLPDGRATRTIVQHSDSEVWTLAPEGSGPAIHIFGYWTEHYTYPVPGDRDSRIETWTGADWQATAPRFGVVFHDVGFLRFNPGVGNGIDYTHGPTDSDHGDLDLVIDDICAALG